MKRIFILLVLFSATIQSSESVKPSKPQTKLSECVQSVSELAAKLGDFGCDKTFAFIKGPDQYTTYFLCDSSEVLKTLRSLAQEPADVLRRIYVLDGESSPGNDPRITYKKCKKRKFRSLADQLAKAIVNGVRLVKMRDQSKPDAED